jgi:polygalacturonase
LTAYGARNTDGVDPSAAGDGYIVYSRISTGDDQVALKCGKPHVDNSADTGPSCRNITIAHNHFGTGHGISIGSETNAGLDGLHVYDLSIDGLLPTGGAGKSSLNGIRIKSDRSCGGLVRNVVYEDVCMRGLANPLLLNPTYDTSATGNAIPTFQNITVRNTRHVDCSATATVPAPVVTLVGFDANHASTVTLDNVMIDGITDQGVVAQNANVTVGPGPINFSVSGAGVNVTNVGSNNDLANSCAGKFVAFPALP